MLLLSRCFTGYNEAAKSTLLRVLAGNVAPDEADDSGYYAGGYRNGLPCPRQSDTWRQLGTDCGRK